MARGMRATDSTASAAAQGVLQVDDVLLTAGRLYRISTSNLLMTSSVAGDAPSARMSATYDGTVATTASTVIAICNGPAIPASGTGNGVLGIICQFYVPAVNETLSVLLYTTRLTGTGNVKLIAPATNPITILVEDLGVDTGDIGVDI